MQRPGCWAALGPVGSHLSVAHLFSALHGVPRATSAQLLQLFTDLEQVLSCDQRFMLGPWLRMARQRATTELVSKGVGVGVGGEGGTSCLAAVAALALAPRCRYSRPRLLRVGGFQL